VTPAAGDVLLSTGSGLVERLIQFAEARRYGRSSREARWSHAGMVTGPGTLVEAKAKGMAYSRLSDYDGRDHVVLRPRYDADGAGEAARAISSMVGEHYGYLTVVCLALAFVFQTRLRFGMDGTRICSGAVAVALMTGGVDLRPQVEAYPEWCSPADLLHVALAQEWAVVV
jgi:uncharacterized protein YycO